MKADVRREKEMKPEEGQGEIVSSENMFRRALGDLEHEAAGISETLADKGVACADDPICREAELMVELYRAEHDNAGAFKFKRLNRETVALFESGRIIRSESGEYALPPELAKRRYLIIGLTELDRLNKEGHSQEAGDAGLRAVIRAIDAVSAEYLGAERSRAKSIFRLGGSEYCVQLDDVTEEELSVLERVIASTPLDLGEEYRRIEAPPLAVSGMSLADTVADLNRTGFVGEPDPRAAAQKTVSLLRRQADFHLEAGKYATRVKRVIAKLRTAGTRGEVKSFFESYHLKGFQGTGVEKLEDIEELIAKFEGKEGLEHEIAWRAEEAARQKFAAERQADAFEDHVVVTRWLGIIHEQAAHDYGEEAGLAERLQDSGERIAVIPPVTRGQSVIVAKDLARRDAASSDNPEVAKWTRVRDLEYQIEVARRDAGTGLLERGQFYEDLDRQVRKAEASGEKAAVIFVDMGFLKYFNDAGGRRVGDAALRKAAEVMEDALEQAGVRGEIYRYGGDEFAIRILGGRKEAAEVQKSIEELRQAAGRIPDLPGLQKQEPGQDLGHSREDYAPTELVFNSGVAELEDFFRVVNDLRESGELDKLLAARELDEAGLKAELLVKLADTSVNYEKAVSRFHLLLGLMSQEQYQDPSTPYHNRVESIIRYSSKAILGPLGGEAALRIFAEAAHHEEKTVVTEQIGRFVADRLERLKDLTAKEKAFADQLIELHVVQKRLQAEVQLLTARLHKQEVEAESAERRIKELQAKWHEAEKARQGVIEARRDVRRATLDKTGSEE